MKFINKKVILFDLDGTLIDSAPDLAHSVNYMLKKMNRKTFSESTIRSWVGNGAEVLVKRALSGTTHIDENIDPKLVEKALTVFLHFYAENLAISTKTYPHVKSTLEALKKDGYRLAIITNKPFDFIAPILKGLELDMLFEHCLGGDSLSVKKPDPKPLLHMCKELNVTVEESVMVGDSKNDIKAANSASMQSIGVSYGYNYDEPIATYHPDIVLNDFKDILECFGALK
ncbi:MAG: phosphoglycolate phosphatase [Campylobacterota bacterium]|nr:phosphoglycolate phosphatase [Campylobacterota bacterium]